MRRSAVALSASVAMCSCQLAFSTVGSWTTGTPPPAPITTNNIVALADGRVAIFGGVSLQTGQESSTLALYDPAARTWSAGAPMPGPTFPDVIALLHDGTVLVEGGQDPNAGISAQTWLYDPVGNAWIRAGDMLQARTAPSATVLTDGRVLVAGGVVPLPESAQQPGPNNFQSVGSAEIFDPNTRKWSPAGRLHAARNGFALVRLLGGGALAAGGCIVSNVFPTPGMVVAEVYEPASNSWASTAPVPDPVCGGTGVALRDGRVLLVDQTLFGSSSHDAFLYDPKSRAWAAAGTLAGGGTTAVLLSDGRVMVPETQPGSPRGRIFIDEVGGQVFDPTANQWNYVTTTEVPLPLVYLFAGGTSLAVSLPDGTVLVILQTVTLSFHPEIAPPATQLLDSTGLTALLLAIAFVISLLMLLAYRRAGRMDPGKLA